MNLPANKGIFERAYDWYFGPVDPIFLRAIRMLLGSVLFFYMLDRAGQAEEWLTNAGFHVSLEATEHGRAAPLPLLSAGLLYPFLGLYFTLIVLMTCGVFGRWSILGTWLCTVYVTLADREAAYTINLVFDVSLLVLFLAPRPVEIEENGQRVMWQCAWPMRVLQLTIVLQYAAAGWCKLTSSSWVHHTDVVWTQSQGFYRTAAASWLLRNLPMWVWTVQQHMAFAFELLAPILFFTKKGKWIGMFVGVGFHLVVALCMHKLIYFSAQMIAFYVLFLPASWLHAVEDFAKGVIPWKKQVPIRG